VFLFDGPSWTVWVAVLVALAAGGWIADRLMHQRRWRRQLRRRREIRARLRKQAAAEAAAAGGYRPAPELDLREPAIEIDLRDRAVYGSEITLESGHSVESGIVGPNLPE
jgi:hypothetical protein